MEADLDRFYHRDLRDLWRVDERGRPLLTYRMVFVRMKELPPDSALAIDQNGGKKPWSISEFLLADLWEIQANRGRKRGQQPKRHPARPVVKKRRTRTPEQQRQHDAAMKRHRRIYQQHYHG